MKVLVCGAGSVLGHEIARDLAARGHEVTMTARRDVPGLSHERLDLTDEASVRRFARGQEAAVLTPILTVSAPAVRWMAEEGLGRAVLFSSNNVGIDRQSPVYAGLRQAEASLAGLGLETAVLRPTMIYGHPGDGNLSKLLRFALRYGFLPCPGRGGALQQPVFVEDLARAASGLAEGGSTGTYSVAGPAPVTTAELFAEVLRTAGRSPKAVIKFPLAPLHLAAGLGEALRLPLPLGRAQLARIGRDKTPTEAPPPGFGAQVPLAEGLARLASDLADSSSDG